jgi:glutathione peroxidase-family protein
MRVVGLHSFFILSSCILWKCANAVNKCGRAKGSISDYILTDFRGNYIPYHTLEGRPIIATNVATECGYTHDNYRDLILLHEKFAPHGLVILAQPCNQFGMQEPHENAQIIPELTRKNPEWLPILNQGEGFHLLEKADVVGPKAHPLFWWYDIIYFPTTSALGSFEPIEFFIYVASRFCFLVMMFSVAGAGGTVQFSF